MWPNRDVRLILLEKAIGGVFVLAEFLLIQAWLSPLLGQPRPAAGPPIEITIQIIQFLPPRSEPTPTPAPPTPQPDPVEIPVTSGGQTVGTAYPGTCGNAGKFRTVVFSDAFNWAFRDTAVVELNGREIDFRQFLRGEGPQRIMAEAEEIVALGAASCEGLNLPFLRDVREEKRAQARAAQLGAWIEEVQPPGPEHAPVHRVHTLNLGRYERDEPCAPDNNPETRNQRKVILVAVLRRDPTLGLAECLKESFGEHATLKPLVTRYSRFGLDEDWALLQSSHQRYAP